MIKKSQTPGRSRWVVVVGGGCSGVLTTLQLLRQAHDSDCGVVLVESRPRFGRGLAYSIWDDSMLLNVPAGNMSALADEPNHFMEYCREMDPSLNGGSFVSRRIYGDYLEHVLATTAASSSVELRRIRGQVVRIQSAPDRGGFEVTLADGAVVMAGDVILACGFLGAQKLPFAQGLAESPRYIENPWNFRAMDAIPPGEAVLVIGTGHTAIDALFRLSSLDDSREVILLSRRGLLPKSHRILPQPPAHTDFPAYLAGVSATALGLMRALRAEVRKREFAGGNWRDVLNELRPHTRLIWERWPQAERRRFLSKIRPWWDIHRHRLAPAAAARLKSQLSSGHTQVLAGQIMQMRPEDDAVAVTIRMRNSGGVNSVRVAAVINCTGPDYDIDRASSPLVAQLRSEGYIQPDPLRLGLEVDMDYRVIGQGGQAIEGLYYVGPMLRARYWEAIAVPELRVHAKQLVKRLLS